jgi:hypothetical protein
MGVVVFLFAGISFAVGHWMTAAVLGIPAMGAVVIATRIGRLAMLKLEISRLFRFHAKFRIDRSREQD